MAGVTNWVHNQKPEKPKISSKLWSQFLLVLDKDSKVVSCQYCTKSINLPADFDINKNRSTLDEFKHQHRNCKP